MHHEVYGIHELTLLLMCMLVTGWSPKLVKLSSMQTKRDDMTEIVRVKAYDTESPPPVTRFSNSILGRDVGSVPINCRTHNKSPITTTLHCSHSVCLRKSVCKTQAAFYLLN